MRREKIVSKKTNGTMRRRDFLKTSGRIALGAAAVGQFPFLLNCGDRGARRTGGRLIILGFDGVEPSLFESWASQGHLPNMQRLREAGSYAHLGSTNPPNSPVAWSTFATGLNPGDHNIFDLIKREPQYYLPDLATGQTEDPKFDADGRLISPPRGITYRDGTPFWVMAAKSGVRSAVLNLPYAFPPDPMKRGRMLSALGTPDLRGTNSTFYYLASDLPHRDDGKSIAGGQLLRLRASGAHLVASIEGPVDFAGNRRKRLTVPLSCSADANARSVDIQLGEEKHAVGERQWSPWYTVQYEITPQFRARAICRLFVLQASPEVQLYLSPLCYDPRDPYIPISTPTDFSAQLAKDHGLFKTVGWVHDTSALNSERIDEGVFLDEMFTIMDWREKMTLAQLRQGKDDLFISVFTATDRAAHMFFRLLDSGHPRYDAALAEEYGDALLKVYEKMDHVVGQVMASLNDKDTLMVLSDHGFHSFRRGLNVNSWLVQNGFMALKTGQRYSTKEFLQEVDWQRTQAYSLGTGQVYINLEGREGQGIVSPNGEYQEVVDRIARGLEKVRDPQTGDQVLIRAYLGRSIYHGKHLDEAPDIRLGFRDGYRTSWETTLGGIPRELIVDNTKKWSGDHAASDTDDTPGILLSNKKLLKNHPDIIDMAPTALAHCAVEQPECMAGQSILDAG
jgi:predicted AlkP superfamily phosphohydrolase/phosphomutase